MNRELRCCPFCGGLAHLCEFPVCGNSATGAITIEHVYRVECDNYCAMQVNTHAKLQAIDEWNKRA